MRPIPNVGIIPSVQVEESWPWSRPQHVFDRRAVSDQQMLVPGRVHDSKPEGYTYVHRVSFSKCTQVDVYIFWRMQTGTASMAWWRDEQTRQMNDMNEPDLLTPTGMEMMG